MSNRSMAIDEYHNLDRRALIELTPKSKNPNRHSRSKELIQTIKENCQKNIVVVQEDHKRTTNLKIPAKFATKASPSSRLTGKNPLGLKSGSGQLAGDDKSKQNMRDSKTNVLRPRQEWSNEKKAKSKDLFGRKCKSKDIVEDRSTGIFTQYRSTDRDSKIVPKKKGSFLSKKSTPFMVNSGSQSSKFLVETLAPRKADVKKVSPCKQTPQKEKFLVEYKCHQNLKIENKDFISKMLNINVVKVKSDLKNPLCYVKAGSNSTSKPSNKNNSPRESTMNTLKEKSRSNETGPKLSRDIDLKSVEGTPIPQLQLSTKQIPVETSKIKSSYSNQLQLEQKKKLSQKCKTAGSSKERNTNIKFNKDLLV
jgi:hypothetical protein